MGTSEALKMNMRKQGISVLIEIQNTDLRRQKNKLGIALY